MLTTILPLALVDFAVGPLKYAESLLFVFEVVALVLPTVWPHKQPFAVHLVVLPLAVVLAAIWPGVAAETFDLVVFELSCVNGAVFPYESSLPVLQAVNVITRILWMVLPLFLSFSMLLVGLPLSFVFCSVHVFVNAPSFSSVIVPLAFVHISLWMHKASESFAFILQEESLIVSSIRPQQLTSALAQFSSFKEVLLNRPFAKVKFFSGKLNDFWNYLHFLAVCTEGKLLKVEVSFSFLNKLSRFKNKLTRTL